MKKVWIVEAEYFTGGVLIEGLAAVSKETRPTRKQMEHIFHSAKRAQSFNNVVKFHAYTLPVVSL